MKKILTETLKTSLRNEIFHTLRDNIYANQSDKLILSDDFSNNILQQTTNISNIFTVLMDSVLPAFIIFTAVAVFYAYNGNVISVIYLLITIVISMKISTKDHVISYGAIIKDAQNIVASKFWNISSKLNKFTFVNKSTRGLIMYVITILIAVFLSCLDCYFYSSMWLLDLLLSILKIKLFVTLIYSIRRVRSILLNINEISEYLICVVHETKSYSLTFLNTGGFVEIENLTYVNGEYFAIKDLTLSIKTGEVVVITGHYGKTVLLNIISGLLWNYEGSVFVNNVNIAYVSSEFISKNVAYIMSIKSLFIGMTIEENILLGSENLIMPLEEILEFTNLTGIHGFFKKGLNTVVTDNLYIPKEIINKIAIARAICRLKTSGILVIDSPYSINSKLCMKLIKDKRLTNGKTIIISDKGSEFMEIADSILFIDSSGKCHYSPQGPMPNEYFQLITSNLYV